MNLKLYTYENCGTCRKALQFLQRRGIQAKPIPIREQPPTRAELKQMLAHYGGNIRKLFNTSGRNYKEMKLGEKIDSMAEAEAIDLLSNNGNLVKRPFLLAGDKGVVGFDDDTWSKVLK